MKQLQAKSIPIKERQEIGPALRLHLVETQVSVIAPTNESVDLDVLALVQKKEFLGVSQFPQARLRGMLKPDYVRFTRSKQPDNVRKPGFDLDTAHDTIDLLTMRDRQVLPDERTFVVGLDRIVGGQIPCRTA